MNWLLLLAPVGCELTIWRDAMRIKSTLPITGDKEMTEPSKSFLDSVACDNATDGLDADRWVRIEYYHGEPIFMAEYEDQPTEYHWDGDDETYGTAEEVKDAIRRSERSEETFWAIKPEEFR